MFFCSPNVAVISMMATMAIVSPGFTVENYIQADSIQSNANSAATKFSPGSKSVPNSRSHLIASKSPRPERENTAGSVNKLSRGQSSAAIDGWQYCLAASHAEHKVYISLPFRKSVDPNTETAFAQKLRQVQHAAVQCPI